MADFKVIKSSLTSDPSTRPRQLAATDTAMYVCSEESAQPQNIKQRDGKVHGYGPHRRKSEWNRHNYHYLAVNVSTKNKISYLLDYYVANEWPSSDRFVLATNSPCIIIFCSVYYVVAYCLCFHIH